MVKARSPQYPAIGLKEAIEKVRAVYEQDYQNAIPRDLVAEHMGYQSLHGKALAVLSALLKFGLLEGRGAETRVSDLAVQIIAHPTGTSERAQAVADASAKPELFKELDSRFSGKASDQAIRSYLLTQKFIPNAADAVILAYRETKSLVEAEARSYDSGLENEQSGHQMNIPQAPAAPPTKQSPPASPLIIPAASANEFNIGLQTDRVIVSASLMDREMAKQLIIRLEAIANFLPAQVAKIEDTKPPSPERAVDDADKDLLG